MKKIGIVAYAMSAVLLSVGANAAFAQTGGGMSNDTQMQDTMKKDSMDKGAMSHDSMGDKGAMSHDQMGKSKMGDAMGKDHSASGTMAH
ncbi:MAG TPA: pentapeptide MXKDX repeat protein [Paraburkholderia sp.]|jgi:pentapeptide MXKDX repeat protein|nr:pentapeptide MXKDX repeat protein [Paraburkholderia sp.]